MWKQGQVAAASVLASLRTAQGEKMLRLANRTLVHYLISIGILVGLGLLINHLAGGMLDWVMVNHQVPVAFLQGGLAFSALFGAVVLQQHSQVANQRMKLIESLEQDDGNWLPDERELLSAKLGLEHGLDKDCLELLKSVGSTSQVPGHIGRQARSLVSLHLRASLSTTPVYSGIKLSSVAGLMVGVEPLLNAGMVLVLLMYLVSIGFSTVWFVSRP